MTCYFDPATADVYDHEGAKIGNLDDDTDWGQSWSGDFPREVLDALRDAMEGTKPSAYNQALLADMSSENIEKGTPPEQS
jgi:hypothetical protein